MKKKIVSILAAIFLCTATLGLFMACGETPAAPAGPSAPAEPSAPEAAVPTAAEIVTARQNAVNETVQGYDFSLTLTGDFSVLGIGASLSGKYDGAYRYDSSSDDVTFRRTTSGPLLFDSTCYVFTSGDSRIKITMDGSSVKKLSVEIPEEQNITMVNLPVVALVDSVKTANIGTVTALKDSGYSYSCPLTLNAASTAGSVLNRVFEKLGTGVSLKGIQLSANASNLEFNMENDKINDFHFGFQMEVGVKGLKVALGIDYVQKSSSAPITLPNTVNSGILYSANDIQKEVAAINAAIEDLKDDPVYSLDLTAKNEFDPGWNKLAITDSYTARMYKTTIDDAVWFNHSYCYKAHSETDGRESYKYTLGNVNGTDEDNQGTWLISRKSSNTQTRADGVTADTRFDFLTSMVKQQAAEIDCIKKTTSGTTTVYTVYLGKAATQSVQEKIVGMINTNEYDDVIEVDNYFNTDNIVKDASIEIVLTDGKISSIECKTELCYNPTGGDYTAYNVTLGNTISLQVNENLSKAQSYTPPTKVKGTLSWGKNLNDSEYYIL